jgi:hypothetical protein
MEHHCQFAGLVKYLIDQSFKNVFSRTEEDIGMKLDIYVPINVVSKCWDLSADRKFKMATIGGERLYMIFMGRNITASLVSCSVFLKKKFEVS